MWRVHPLHLQACCPGRQNRIWLWPRNSSRAGGSKPWPFSWHLGYPIHSQLPAAACRDFSLAIFTASYLFWFLPGMESHFVSFSQSPLSVAQFLCDQIRFIFFYNHDGRPADVILGYLISTSTSFLACFKYYSLPLLYFSSSILHQLWSRALGVTLPQTFGMCSTAYILNLAARHYDFIYWNLASVLFAFLSSQQKEALSRVALTGRTLRKMSCASALQRVVWALQRIWIIWVTKLAPERGSLQ